MTTIICTEMTQPTSFEVRRKTTTAPGSASPPAITWLSENNYAVSPKNTTEQSRTDLPQSIKQFKPNTLALAPLLAQLLDARRDSEEDDLAPSDFATTGVYLLLNSVSHYLPEKGHLYRDGYGGLRVEWELGNKELTIVMNAEGNKDNYLYWQEGKERALETPLNPRMLSEKLCWLQNR